MQCVPLRRLIQTAYVSFANGPIPSPIQLQILDGPAWIDSDPYDIAAKAVGNAPMDQMFGPMLQVLLEDRFKLKIHHDFREAPVYVLTVAKSGLKMTRTPEGSCTPLDLNHPPSPPAPGQPPPNLCGPDRMGRNGPNETMGGHGMTIAELAGILSKNVDRPIVDRTELTGRFGFHLEFARNMADDTGTSIFTAVQEQLGLKLVPAKGPVEVLVIDHVEKPSEN